MFVSCSGILVPGGFGSRGIEGMLMAIKYAREQKIPYLGICLGFQLAVIEWSRGVLGITGKPTSLFIPTMWHSMHNRCYLDRVLRGRETSSGHLHARNIENSYGGNNAIRLETYGV